MVPFWYLLVYTFGSLILWKLALRSRVLPRKWKCVIVGKKTTQWCQTLRTREIHKTNLPHYECPSSAVLGGLSIHSCLHLSAVFHGWCITVNINSFLHQSKLCEWKRGRAPRNFCLSNRLLWSVPYRCFTACRLSNFTILVFRLLYDVIKIVVLLTNHRNIPTHAEKYMLFLKWVLFIHFLSYRLYGTPQMQNL